MTTTAAIQEDDVEPFGQRGVRPLVRPVIVAGCSLALAVSIAMWFRSQHNYDSLWRVNNNRAVEIASVLGRFMITTRTPTRVGGQSETWNYESQEYATMYDAWQPSLGKTLGIAWGTEEFVDRFGRPSEYWRFRIAWRTACVLAIAPLVIDAILRHRRRRRPAAEIGTPTPAA